jgi:hypothetical protein
VGSAAWNNSGHGARGLPFEMVGAISFDEAHGLTEELVVPAEQRALHRWSQWDASGGRLEGHLVKWASASCDIEVA